MRARGDNGLMEEDDVDAIIAENGVDCESDSDLPQTSVTLPPLLSPVTSSPCAPPLDREAKQKNFNNLNGRVDEPLEDNDSALHLACLYGHLPCVQLLLERGANMEIKDEDEAIPLHDACAGGYLEIVELLF
ncbi:unnamed protein product [Eruca vesicaria subsp. sativa]|uniref:Uncharacterized protein n=1 Tax=Eruca vesicaria subsp. sativa TaxID=29727 RepID=A0ABC8M2X4_ERUVS|nr:unnamed protein product [Eruca vesicaria subsp. sativa]